MSGCKTLGNSRPYAHGRFCCTSREDYVRLHILIVVSHFHHCCHHHHHHHHHPPHSHQHLHHHHHHHLQQQHQHVHLLLLLLLLCALEVEWILRSLLARFLSGTLAKICLCMLLRHACSKNILPACRTALRDCITTQKRRIQFPMITRASPTAKAPMQIPTCTASLRKESQRNPHITSHLRRHSTVVFLPQPLRNLPQFVKRL